MKNEVIESMSDIDAAKDLLERRKIERQQNAARKLYEFIQILEKEEKCVVKAVPFYTPDGRTIASIAVDAVD